MTVIHGLYDGVANIELTQEGRNASVSLTVASGDQYASVLVPLGPVLVAIDAVTRSALVAARDELAAAEQGYDAGWRDGYEDGYVDGTDVHPESSEVSP